MIFARLRRKAPPPAEPPAPEQRGAELALIQAVDAFLASGTRPAQVEVPPGHRPDGLSGTRALCMLFAHADAFAGTADRGTAALEQVRRSLRAEMEAAAHPAAGRSARHLAHLRTLSSFVSGLWASRAAEATQAGAAIDPAEIVAAAAEAVGTLRDEPYLRALQAETLIRLGRAGEAEQALAPVIGAPWLEGWKRDFAELMARSRSATNLLPPGSPRSRLIAMSRQDGWLALAGDELPALLRAEAAGREPPVARPVTVRLATSAADLGDEESARLLIGTADDDAASPTINGLRKALAARFGVLLPGIRMRDDAALEAGHALVTFEGRNAAGTDPPDLALAAAADWWPGAATAHPALLALVVAAERHLGDLDAERPAATRAGDEARRLMLADRMPYGVLEARLRGLLDGGADPVSAVAALRLPPADPIEAEPLWGAEAERTLLLLDRASEDALQAAIVPGIGVAATAESFAALTATLRNRAGARGREGGAPPVTLVVRDVALRPLVRALLQAVFPDLPVLALAEIARPRELVPLDPAAAPRAR